MDKLVYCVVRYGQLIGCYESMDDAAQIVAMSIAKGQLCDLIPKPIIPKQLKTEKNGQTK